MDENTRLPCLVPRRRCESKKKDGARGLTGRERIANLESRTIPQLHGHRAQRSHNSMGTALKTGETPGDEAGASHLCVPGSYLSCSRTLLGGFFSRFSSLVSFLHKNQQLHLDLDYLHNAGKNQDFIY